jgi:hypothetical protein
MHLADAEAKTKNHDCHCLLLQKIIFEAFPTAAG